MPALAIDLYCGLGGWTEGLLAEGYDVIGFDIERHEYDGEKYPAQLVLQDVLTLHGAQFRDAALIVASPPCQFFSYAAMPWTRAKALAAEVRADPERLEKELALFKACFRIQREACEAAGRHIPLVVENVRGAIPWVGRSRWNYGSYHLWGDVPALMPTTMRGPLKPGIAHRSGGATNFHRDLGNGRKNEGGSWFNIGGPGQKIIGQNPDGRLIHRRNGARHTKHLTNPDEHAEVTETGTKIGGDWFSDPQSTCRRHSSKSRARKAASARIAKIPLTLSRWIAATYRPGRPLTTAVDPTQMVFGEAV